jgi:UDP-GlcNAc:undecaprenyl-phosphate/decaprenyl-phosphate GlcNAc-1-phosphate transferase
MILAGAFLLVLVNLILFKFNYKIAFILNLFDKPNNLLKKHSVPTPLTGGIFFLINIFILILIIDFNIIFETDEKLYIFIISLCLIFLVGFFDDKYNVYYLFRIAKFSAIILMLLYFDDSLLISEVFFESLNIDLKLSHLVSFFFTLFCIMIFIFSLNMLDGINLQSALYFFSLVLFFIIKNVHVMFFVFFIIPILFFLYFNYKNKIFLGDSGSYLIAFLLSCLIIKNYNLNNFKIEEILLLMIFPGIDLIRVFVTRLINQKSPFAGDLNHIHHIVSRKCSIIKSNVLIQFVHLSAIVTFFLFDIFFVSLLIFFSLYFFLILYSKIKK